MKIRHAVKKIGRTVIYSLPVPYSWKIWIKNIALSSFHNLLGGLKLFSGRTVKYLNKNEIDIYLKDLFQREKNSSEYISNYVADDNYYVNYEEIPVKMVAFYLPQFHPLPENDDWWGKGFTEWTNVSKAVPQFLGHYQPHLPGELGFYDLRLPEVMKRQIELAKQYGLYGFCFHHYWFGGKRLLEKPVEMFLKDKAMNFPFCICWANENWSRRWDGSENDILIAQKHSAEDDLAFIADLSRLLKDPRYIRVNGMPLVIVYRASILPDPKKTVNRWRKYCLDNGIGEIYLVAAQSFEVVNPKSYGFDAAVEFPPHQVRPTLQNEKNVIFNSEYSGCIFDFDDLVEQYCAKKTIDSYTVFKTVCPGWDNSARKPGRGYTFHNSTPQKYSEWLEKVCAATIENNEAPEKLVFINAWNEWGEGAHLEPDKKFGYAYLAATRSVLSRINRTVRGENIDEVGSVGNS